MKKSLLIVITLLCVASLMAAMAYSSAQVTNAAQLTIVNTEDALLSLKPVNGVGNKDYTSEIVDGNLVFNFNKGNNRSKGNGLGLQKNSVYCWDQLFQVTNNTSESVKKFFEATNVPDGVTIELKRFDNVKWNWFDITNKKSWDKQGNVNYPIYSLKITVSDDVPDDVFEKLQEMSIIVYGVAE